jgi:hypothetical protein
MKRNSHTTSAFSLMDLPSGERLKFEDQIMERALALWRNKQAHHLSLLRRAGRGTLKPRP